MNLSNAFNPHSGITTEIITPRIMTINNQHVDTLDQAFSLRNQMVERQLKSRGISDPRVLAAMLAIPRHRFVPDMTLDAAYSDGPLPIPCGQTISQPYIVAKSAELLELEGSERVLEVGAGCGYLAAVLSKLAREVVAIEYHEALAKQAQAVLKELNISNVLVEHRDGKFGRIESAPYRGIVVSCASEVVHPSWEEQLEERGRLVFPQELGYYQMLRRLTKGTIGWTREEDIFPVRFVPLQ